VRVFYSLVITLLTPIFFLAFFWLGRKNPAWRQGWLQRCGSVTQNIKPNALWLHAASVGEVMAAAPLIKSFQAKYPDIDILVTTFTPTGAEQVKQLFSGKVFHQYLPIDHPLFFKRFVKQLKPGLLVVIERELWPGMLSVCARHSIPVLLANARMSQKSAESYQRFPILIRFMLDKLSMVAVQDHTDGQRYLDLGLPENKLNVTGSMKFDISIDNAVKAEGEGLRKQWGEKRPVLALASSHADEDERLLVLLPKLQQQVSDILLLLIPRHPERFDAVSAAAQELGFEVQRRSQGAASIKTQVYVADTMGEMLKVLSAADVVLMGGSLIERGGHNPIEPAALGKPVLIGPHYFNFTEVVTGLEQAGALKVVSSNSEDLLTALIDLLKDKETQEIMGEAGLTSVERNRGAVGELVKHCARMMLSSY